MHGLDTIRKLNDEITSKNVGDHVKFIVFREHGWLDKNTDFRQWDHLCRAYDGVELQMIKKWDEAEIPEGYTVVLVDGAGDVPIMDFKHPEKAVYVFGRTLLDIYTEIDDKDYEVSVNIPTTQSVPLFGVVAGGIVLQDRFTKS